VRARTRELELRKIEGMKERDKGREREGGYLLCCVQCLLELLIRQFI
jgi:hypothetical protein